VARGAFWGARGCGFAARMALRLQWWWWAAAVLLVLAGAVDAGGGGNNGGEMDAKTLLAVKAGFGNAANALVDWDGGGHCAWRGVACDSASFAVLGLCVSSLSHPSSSLSLVSALSCQRPLKSPSLFAPSSLCICCSNSSFPPLHIYIYIYVTYLINGETP
jgi:hypothetical protein